MTSRSRYALCSLVGLSMIAAARPAGAQTTSVDSAARRELLEQAQAASLANDHARALDLASRAGLIEMTPSVRMFIAQQQSEVGQLAEAYASADTCAREADRDIALRNREQILSTCQSLAASLRTRVGRLVVRVPDPLPAGFHVTVGATPLNPAFYGVSYIVTPGVVRVGARTADGQSFQGSVTIAEGATGEIQVQLATSAAPAAHVEHAEHIEHREPPCCEQPPGSPPPPPSIVPGVALVGAGVLALGASVVFAVLRGSAQSNLAMNCPADPNGALHCVDTEQTRGWQRDDVTYSVSTDVAIGVGVLAAGAGAAMLLLRHGESPAESRSHARITVVPVAGNGAMLTLGGTL